MYGFNNKLEHYKLESAHLGLCCKILTLPSNEVTIAFSVSCILDCILIHLYPDLSHTEYFYYYVAVLIAVS